MDREGLEKMLAEAKNEIAQIERQLADLQAKRDLLWRFVASSKDLVEYDSAKRSGNLVSAGSVLQSGNAASLIVPNSSSVALSQYRVWEAVKLVMGVAKRPVTVPEIIGLLDRHKIIVPGEHPRETVRSAISRKEDVFEKRDRGLYVLREWPESIKQLRKDEALSSEVA